MKNWYTFKIFYYLLRIAMNPKRTNAGLAITDCLYKMGLLAEEAQFVCKDPESKDIVEKRELITIPNIEQLKTLPEGTLGREYSEHMLRENLSPEFFKNLNIKDDETFVMMRLRQSHDLWHTLTGFGTSVPDELGLLAFMMAQVRSPFSPILIAGGLFAAALKRPHETAPIMHKISEGWSLGLRAKPAFAIDWSAHWQTPLSKLRQQYGISSCGFD